ncbi:N-acetyltransferase [Mesorhizobium microcysteis]|uniref:N-acetyltransferase n=1 Tax=Neoaquamicrobium microcysteis TaxID=2682781 RepID=A0A5D4GNZ2_9HYPH|nr:N-acetyltransferase [Mesorhizobium microcysteis]TYR29673.1 N-acetyltransferase [Mesorhizobium microcysteis]
MKGVTIREAAEADRDAIRAVEEAAFGQPDEARLVDALVADGDDVLELVAERDGEILGHVLFSRLMVETANRSFAAVALAPLAVAPPAQKQGIAKALVEEGHRQLRLAGEGLSVVLGDPAYYGRFGYAHSRASRFDSQWQGEALQALAWGADAPVAGRLVYPPAFSAL